MSDASPAGPWPPGWDCHVHVFDASAPVRAGHYRPVHRPLSEVEPLALANGVGRLVLVQPSVYGTDNSVLLQALALQPGRHRGVAVVGDDLPPAELEALHAAGVRGLRLNLVSPVGEAVDTERRLSALAPHLLRLGWHVQWYVRAEQLPAVAQWHRTHGVTCVLDHLGGLGARVPADDPAWQTAAELAALGVWVKLSGWYRLEATEPYTLLDASIRRVADLFGERLVWGSDWPHTAFPADAMPRYPSTWDPVVRALGEREALALRNRLPSLYDAGDRGG